MIVKEEKWHNIPLLHIVEEQYIEKEIPVVIFLHGFTSAKEHNLHYAYNLAKKGIRVLLPDALLHGERSEKLDDIEKALRFWEVVLTSIEELEVIHKELRSRRLVTDQKIGVGGTSMGAITTLGALTQYEWIDTAVSMMGAPGFVELAKAQIGRFEDDGFKLPISEEEKESILNKLSDFDLTKNPVSLANRPVFFWHGKIDPVVPYKPTYTFSNDVQKDYIDVPERISFTTDKTAGHSVSRSGMLSSVDWFASHLNG